MSRDWLKDLWKASYKGAPFWTERDQESGGRRIVKHQFPMRDDPFLEDLGEDLREFDLTAYVASDNADTEAAALAAACASRGAGQLVMPVQGPVLVRCISFTRDSTRDRAGYLGFSLKCCREGAASALISTKMAANQVFTAAEAIASAMASSFAANLTLVIQPATASGPGVGPVRSVPDFVTAAAVNGVQDVAAVLESVRTSEPVEATASAAQRNAIQTLFDQAADLLAVPATVPDVAIQSVAIARALGDAMPPASALRAFNAILSDPGFASVVVAGAVYPTPSRKAMALNADQVMRLLRLAAVTAYCEAIARVVLSDRPAGITLRANAVEYFESETGDLAASEIDLVHRIGALRDATIAYLSRMILDLAPVITLESNVSMPSLFWAYRLYQDPQRSTELVARNKVVHPSFMPAVFEALAK